MADEPDHSQEPCSNCGKTPTVFHLTTINFHLCEACKVELDKQKVIACNGVNQ